MSNGDPAPAPEKRQAAPVQSSAFNMRELLSRLAILAALGGSVFLIWWSFTQVLAPAQRQARESAAAVAKLSAEVDDLQRRWTSDSADQIKAKFNLVQSNLFGGKAGLEAWLAQMNEQAAPLGLELTTEFAQPLPQGPDKRLAIVPATLSINVLPPRTAFVGPTPYRGILQLTQRLAGRPERADLVEITLTGGPKSITSAVLVLNLWAGEGQQP